MGAERTQKGAIGQQLAASGKARRADKLSREQGSQGPNTGRDRSRAVIEDQMDQNDAAKKQKQGKGGRPGKPIDGRPPMPPKDIGGIPQKPPMDDGWKDSRPIEGKNPEVTLPYFPGKPPGGRPGKPPFFEGPLPGPRPDMPDRPPKDTVRDDYINRPDRPGRDRGREEYIRRMKEKEMRRREEQFKRKRRGGTDLGPGRGDRLPEGAEQDSYFSQDRFDALRQQGGQNLERPGAAATTLQDFMEQMANLRGGGMR